MCASIIPNERNGGRTDTFIPVTRDAMADQVAISMAGEMAEMNFDLLLALLFCRSDRSSAPA